MIMRFLSTCVQFLAAAAFCTGFMTGCQTDSGSGERALLVGRAVLPAATMAEGPSVGHHLEPLINGVALPLNRVPVQGFSSLLPAPGNRWLVLQDNGFGTRKNSPDVPLRWYEVSLDLEGNKPHGGAVQVHSHTDLTDPDQHVPFPLCRPDTARLLHGGDFDPESFVHLDDGTFWVGEEFGPYLLHCDGQGRLLEPPVPVPVPGPLRPHGRGSYFLRSPDHPALRDRPEANQQANLPGSGGIESLARNSDGTLLYLAVEKAMVDDPDPYRRSILEFGVREGRFTGNFWFLKVEEPGHLVTSLEWVARRTFLVVERDGEQGADARFKQVFQIDLGKADKNGFVKKTPVCDLLDIRDSFGYSQAEENAVGLGPAFRFPYVTPEAVAVVDPLHLLLCNDNNYPFSDGRRPGVPDDSEFILLKLPHPLWK